MANIIKVPT